MKLKNIIASTILACSISSASAIDISSSTILSVCSGSAEFAVISAQMQRANADLVAKGEPEKYNKDIEAVKSSGVSDIPVISKAYIDATIYGFENYSFPLRDVWKLSYENCKLHFMRNPRY